MFPPREDVLRLLPEIILSLSGIVLMLVEPFLTRARRTILVSIAATGSGLALVATIYPALHPGEAFSGLLASMASACSCTWWWNPWRSW